MKYVIFGLSIALYLVLLVCVYYGFINYFSVNVVFYGAIYAAIVALVLFALVLYLLPLFSIFSNFEKVNVIIISCLLGYVFAISLPTVIDRSLSFYILEKLQQRGGAIQLSKFEYIFTNEYMQEHKLVDVRLTEQSESGTIVIDGDCVRLTAKGNSIADFSRLFKRHFLPKKRLLRGKYTDQLVDPFSKSDTSPDYLCK